MKIDEKMSWEELEREVEEAMHMKDEAVRMLMNELNGKVMNYESCRIIEDTINLEREMWMKIVKEIIDKVKEKMELKKK